MVGRRRKEGEEEDEGERWRREERVREEEEVAEEVWRRERLVGVVAEAIVAHQEETKCV